MLFNLYKKTKNLFSGKRLGRIPGVRLVNSFIFELLRPKGISMVVAGGIKFFVNAENKNIVQDLLLDARHDSFEIELFKKSIKPGMVVVDIGANIGYYSLVASKLVGKEGCVYAFEPEPDNYDLLCKNIAANSCVNVIPVKRIVSDRSGLVKLWFEKKWLGSPSLSEKNVLITSGHPDLREGGFIEEQSTTLDDYFKEKGYRVDVLKMDVEGSEGLIIDGASKILENSPALKIFTEFWPPALRNLGTDPSKLINKFKRHSFKISSLVWRKQGLRLVEDEAIIESDKVHHLFLEKIKI